ncbi:MAG: hypothetical protein LQ350_006253 [Teloschistes chrysophthalmus]|nr:MAG: hypothetical protein LQ350_006253 [Niorma chrysophthalma]
MDSPQDSPLQKHLVKSHRVFYASASNAIGSDKGNKEAQILPPSNAEQGPSPLGHSVTPDRPLPNSSKKRIAPNLSRGTPAPSHHNSMSAIFQEAGRVLQAPSTPPTFSTNARKLRLPLLRSGEARKRLVASNVEEDMCKEPAKSSSPAPIADNLATELPQLDGVLYPDLPRLEPSPSPSSKGISPSRGTSEGESCSAIPEIANWLKNVRYEAVERVKPLPNSTRSKSVSPSRIPVASLRPLRSPRNSPKTIHTGLLTPRRLPHPLTPHRFQTDSFKRNLSTPSPHNPPSPEKGNQDFDIYEDSPSDDLAELSPRVEKHRKGNRPRRDRCASYWDEDILKENVEEAAADKGWEKGKRQVLGELPELTKAKVFMEGVENAKFDFRVEG